MTEEVELEDELIRLSEIFETLKKDALEVSDLLVKGVDYYRISGYICILIGFISSILVWNQYLPRGDIFGTLIFVFLALLLFITGIYSLYKHRGLKKKYKELIEIQKSLTEK